MHIDSALVRRLHVRARGERWRVTPERFAAALTASAARSFGETPASGPELESYLAGLHLEDLALACACLDGNEQAWDALVASCRPALHRAADALDPHGGAREAADAMFGELFAGAGASAERTGRPLLSYFHGRSSLVTWLRSVLAQRFVDRVRALSRQAELPDDDAPRALPAQTPHADPDRERHVAIMHAALGDALAALPSRDRLRLACYYAQGLTLAETGRLLGEHEATVSRQLARTRQALKIDVERRLRETAGLNEAGIAECFESVAADAGPLSLQELIGPRPERAHRVEGAPPEGVQRLEGRKKDGGGRSKKEQQV